MHNPKNMRFFKIGNIVGRTCFQEVVSFVILFTALLSARPVTGQWVRTNGPYDDPIGALTVIDSTLLAGEGLQANFSTDGGSTWQYGLVESLPDYVAGEVHAFAWMGTLLFEGTDAGVLASSDSGRTWLYKRSNVSPYGVMSIAAVGNTLLAGTGKGLFRSNDSNASWSADIGLGDRAVNSLITIDSVVFAGTDSGVFVSSDNGESWQRTSALLDNASILSFATNGTNLYAGTAGRGFARSSDGGNSWMLSDSGIAGIKVLSLGMEGTSIFAGADSGRIFRSIDGGVTWSKLNTGITFAVVALASIGSEVFAAVDRENSFGVVIDGEGVFRSTDSGISWSAVGISNHISFDALEVWGSTLFAGGDRDVYGTLDNGQTWHASNGLVDGSPILALERIGNYLIAGTGSGAFRSQDSGKNWTAIDSGLPNARSSVEACAVMGSMLFLSAGTVFRSSDSGTTWQTSGSGLTDPDVFALASLGSDLFAGTYNKGIFRSTDSGKSWLPANGGLGSNIPEITSLLADSSFLYAAVAQDVFRSTDSGVTWQSSTTPLHIFVKCLACYGSTLFAGTDGSGSVQDSNGVYVSLDHGVTWNRSASGLPQTDIRFLAVGDSDIFAGTGDGVWRRPLSEMIPPAAVKETGAPEIAAQAFPNPFPSQTSIRFATSAPGFARVSVVNALGEEVARLYSGELSSGEHSFSWNAANSPAGMYFCLIQTAAGREVVSVRHE